VVAAMFHLTKEQDVLNNGIEWHYEGISVVFLCFFCLQLFTVYGLRLKNMGNLIF